MVAIVQSQWGQLRRTANRGYSAGAIVATEFIFDSSVGLLAANILELGILPANSKIVNALMFTENDHGALTVNVGIMSGTVGDPDPARTLGNELFAAQALTTAHTAIVSSTKPAMVILAAATSDRSIGLQISGNLAAVAGQKIHLIVNCVQ
jgi:hypothetical protein